MKDIIKNAANAEELRFRLIEKVKSGQASEAIKELEEVLQDPEVDQNTRIKLSGILFEVMAAAESHRSANFLLGDVKELITTAIDVAKKPIDAIADAIANISSVQKEIIEAENKLFAKETTRSFSEKGEEISHQIATPGKQREQAVVIAKKDEIEEVSIKRNKLYDSFGELFPVVRKNEELEGRSNNFWAIAVPKSYSGNYDPLTMNESQIMDAFDCLRREMEMWKKGEQQEIEFKIFADGVYSEPAEEALKYHKNAKEVFLKDLEKKYGKKVVVNSNDKVVSDSTELNTREDKSKLSAQEDNISDIETNVGDDLGQMDKPSTSISLAKVQQMQSRAKDAITR